VNDAPTANTSVAGTAEDTPLNGAVTGHDVDGDALTFTLVSGPDGLVLNPDGTFTYMPPADFNGEFGFVYSALDAWGSASEPAQVTVTVSPVADAPVVVAPVIETNEDKPVTVSVVVSDVENDVTAVTVVGGPAHGTLWPAGQGMWVYTPSANYHGPDQFVVRVTDDSGLVTEATVHITVHSVNDAPTARASDLTIAEDTPLSGAVSGEDVENDSLTFILITGPAHGTVELNANGTFTYTPGPDYNGADQFTFKVSDGADHSAPATVSVTVTPVNERPVGGADFVATIQDTRIEIPAWKLTANDSDPDGGSLAIDYESVTQPGFGTVKIVSGQVIYTPGLAFSGTDTFTYVLTDGEFKSEAVTVTVHVARAEYGHVAVRGDGVVIVNGSPNSDVITLSSVEGWLKISISNALGTINASVLAPSKRVVVFGYGGDDEIRVGHSVPVPAWLYGDAGRDALELGSQGGIAFGGDDNDQLGGGGGRDILIGGEGADNLIGAGEGDILIAPLTEYDDRFAFARHEEAWYAIRSEWNSSRIASQRISNLRGTGTGERLNGDYFLSRDKICDDQSSWPQDTLSGRGGADWYFLKADEDKATGSGTWELL
jgi:VCBS repeat-containing protein